MWSEWKSVHKPSERFSQFIFGIPSIPGHPAHETEELLEVYSAAAVFVDLVDHA